MTFIQQIPFSGGLAFYLQSVRSHYNVPCTPTISNPDSIRIRLLHLGRINIDFIQSFLLYRKLISHCGYIPAIRLMRTECKSISGFLFRFPVSGHLNIRCLVIIHQYISRSAVGIRIFVQQPFNVRHTNFLHITFFIYGETCRYCR